MYKDLNPVTGKRKLAAALKKALKNVSKSKVAELNSMIGNLVKALGLESREAIPEVVDATEAKARLKSFILENGRSPEHARNMVMALNGVLKAAEPVDHQSPIVEEWRARLSKTETTLNARAQDLFFWFVEEKKIKPTAFDPSTHFSEFVSFTKRESGLKPFGNNQKFARQMKD